MSATFSSGKVNFEVSLGASPTAARRDPDAPLNILVMGNFSGRTGEAKPMLVDCDNFDQVLTKARPSCRISLAGQSTELTFSSLDDFHPDKILSKIDALIRPES